MPRLSALSSRSLTGIGLPTQILTKTFGLLLSDNYEKWTSAGSLSADGFTVQGGVAVTGIDASGSWIQSNTAGLEPIRISASVSATTPTAFTMIMKCKIENTTVGLEYPVFDRGNQLNFNPNERIAFSNSAGTKNLRYTSGNGGAGNSISVGGVLASNPNVIITLRQRDSGSDRVRVDIYNLLTGAVVFRQSQTQRNNLVSTNNVQFWLGNQTDPIKFYEGATFNSYLSDARLDEIYSTSYGAINNPNNISALPFVNGGLMTYNFQGADGATTTTQTSGSLSSTITLTDSTLSTTRAPSSGLTSLFVNGSAGTATARAEVTGLNIAPTNFTWEGWIYYPSFSTASTAVTVFSVGQNSANLLAVRWLSPTLIEFRTNINGASVGQGGNVFGITAAPSSGIWQHHAITADGSNYRYYLDGTQIGSTTNNAGTWGTGPDTNGKIINAYTIGNWISAPFSGSWSNAYYWNCRLSNSVVYSSNFTVTKTGMV